jgi:hydroxypyruvate isomerase
MDQVRQSFCYPLFREGNEPLEDLFALAKEIGFQATELWDRAQALDEISDAARVAGLGVASMFGHSSSQNGLNDESQHDRIAEELDLSIRKASESRVPGLICFSGNRIPGQGPMEAMIACTKCLRRVAKLAEERGVNLNLQILNSRIDNPNYQADEVEFGLAVCEAAQSPRVKVAFHVYHVQIMQGDILRRLERAEEHLGHVQTGGVPGRHELDETQELNYRAVARCLVNLNYPYFVGHELVPRGNKHKALRQAYEALRL